MLGGPLTDALSQRWSSYTSFHPETEFQRMNGMASALQRFIETPPHLHWGIYTKRDSLLSIAYSEELISATISATLQRTDRHHGIVGQKRCHFQGDS